MRFSLAATAFIPVLSAAAADILVTVGGNGQLAFSPTNITANPGDTVSFQFQSKNHSVTQSTFNNPCAIQTTPAQGIDSDFQFVPANATQFPQWSITITNGTSPLWFFCKQTVPADHCNLGMVFSINANPNSAKSFAAYQALAMGNNAAASAPGSVPSAVASVAGAATSAIGSVAGEATAAAGSAGAAAATDAGNAISQGISDATGLIGGSNPSPTNSAGNSTQSQPSTGFRVGSSSASLLAVVGLAAGLLL